MGENCAGWTEKSGKGRPCQFAVEPDEFLFDGNPYCRFHLPMGEEGEGGKADWDDFRKELISRYITASVDVEMKKPEVDRVVLNFRGIVVPAEIDLSKRNVPYIWFGYAAFFGDANFERAHFISRGEFREARFSRNTVFREAEFSGDADFYAAQFLFITDFEWAQFSLSVDFGEAQFCSQPKFYNAHFLRNANFRKTRFTRGAFFNDAKFCENAGHNENVQFNNAYFGGSALFLRAHFFSDAKFVNADFSAAARFRSAHFHEFANFSSNLPSESDKGRSFKTLDLKNATFGGGVRFSSREFMDRADFRVTEFKHAPEFHSATLHQNTIFPEIECFQERNTARAAQAYQTLRLAMESQRNRDKEGMFFALEKNSRRRCGEITGVAKLIDLGYEWGSLYGLRILRPLMWLIGGIGVSALLLTGVWAHSAAGGPAGGVIFTQAFGDALLFSAKQSFLPFDALRAEKLDYVFNPYGTGWLRVLGFFQTLYSALCILLLILAVRWRYRR